MKIVGLMLCRNSDWVIGLTLRAALQWCDEVAMILHSCSDGTLEIVEALTKEFPGRIWAQERSCLEWYEMQYRQDMLLIARSRGASHIALIDDDELLTANLLPKLRDWLEPLPFDSMAMLPWLCTTNGLESVITSGMWASQNASVCFRDLPKFHWAARDGYDFHQRNPLGGGFAVSNLVEGRNAGLIHLQFASMKRLKAKQYLYQLTEMKRWGRVRHDYSRTVVEAAASVRPVPDSWLGWYREIGILNETTFRPDAEPWQEAECKRLLAENPALGNGLNDFGLRREWGL
jgi:hypothetical protein